MTRGRASSSRGGKEDPSPDAPRRAERKAESRADKRRATGKAKSSRRRAVLLAGAGLGLVAAACLGLLIALAVFAGRKGPGDGAVFVVEIPKGASSRDVARLLAEQGAVSNEPLMALYLTLSKNDAPIPGEHVLFGGSTPGELAACLGRSKSRRAVKVVIPEGFHRFQIAERLESLGVTSSSAFVRVSGDPQLLELLDVPAPAGRGPASAEGYLFPATYELQIDSPAYDVLHRLVNESHVRWRRLASKHEAGVTRLAEKLGWGRAEIVTLASMVEKEAAVDEERPLIAGVFLNRLMFADFKPKLLQSDPTSGYGCLAAPDQAPSCASFDGKKITPAMNRDELNRYSTYTNEGLPPGPIASPGERSIAAVLSPTESRYLFFVASGGGRHKFSETLEEHNKAVHR